MFVKPADIEQSESSAEMAFKALLWYCRPVEDGVWAKAAASSFGSYTPCAIDSLVMCISYLILLGLCIYRIWGIRKNYGVKRFRLRSNYYNYMLGLLAAVCTAEPILRLVMDWSMFNLDGQSGLAPYEVSSHLLFLSYYHVCIKILMYSGISYFRK